MASISGYSFAPGDRSGAQGGWGAAMTPELALEATDFEARAISPLRELGAYEALWEDPEASFKTISEKFRARPGAVPSDFVPARRAEECAVFVQEQFRKAHIDRYGVRVHGAGEYPTKLRDAVHPVELIYYQGWWDLVNSRSVAVVGTREPTPEGVKRTQQLVQKLVRDRFTIVSGLAAGVDTAAHETAIAEGGRTIAVIGTPLSHSYPRDNAELQRKIASEFLIISQVPVRRYEKQDYRRNRLFFPERNITMSALTEATIIVEAGETSGTLIQARAALKQGRKLFILDSCFRKKGLTWPRKFEERGGVRVVDYDDIQEHLAATTH
jgi:DNA processing protein